MSTTVSLPLLDGVRIASPCHVRWEDMQGDDRTRRCDQCSLNVHNISGMTRAAAESFLADRAAAGGRTCATFYRRADGTILTADCPVGLAAVRAKARRAAARIAAALGITSLISWAAAHQSGGFPFAHTQPLSALANYLRGTPPAPPITRMVAGEIYIPTPKPGR